MINTEATKAKHYLSRGQQKIVLIAMKLAQKYFIEKDCLYLFDDFSAELDDFHQEKLLNYLQQSKGQYFLTSPKEGLITELLSASSCSTFNLTKVE